MLHINTVSDDLLAIIQRVCEVPEFKSFRLVGGTALSLYLGHRISVDADFFTDNIFDKKEVEQAIIREFPNAMKINEAAYGFTWVFQDIKVDFYDWKVPFLLDSTRYEGIRLASLEDIAAYKLDAIVGRKTEKDYRDMAELLKHYSLIQLLGFYQKKFPYNNPRIVIDHLSAYAIVPLDASIVLLNNDAWNDVQQQIDSTITQYFGEIQRLKDAQTQQREAKIQTILARKKS